MTQGKKFGTFAGVFTPSILTILGVIMFLRMGWVVGNAGLLWTILIIIGAHVISITTGLSISSISTDKKVGAGGVYYVLSRSLGLPIGGALGLTLFVATALSIALYMVGFAEIFNEYFKYGFELTPNGEAYIEGANYKSSLRITGTLGLLVLTVIAFISTSIALKIQFFILGAIVLSLFSIFFGDGAVQPILTGGAGFDKAGLALVFAIFFPAVTGFTAGVAMSGDLKNPKKSIPLGTMGSIATGLIIYLVLGIFIYFSLGEEILLSNPRALFEMALIPFLVYLGVWGATLSSALGGILGGPRILQAMSVDKITPAAFGVGVGKDNEPRNALLLTVIIAEAGILIGDLNVIAEVVSMFYLAAYGFINLSFFLESWASSDFNPTFKVKKWVGLVGFVATFTIMSQLNMLAMIVAIIVIIGVFYFLSRKQVALGTGDIWQSVWATIVKKGLKRMEAKQDHKRNWKPNTLLFSTGTAYRTKMIEFSKAVSGQNGIITNFDLIENIEATVLFPKNKEAVSDEELEKYGIFGRKLEVQNTFRGIESIACTFGFSGIEPNTVLMAWPGKTNHPIWFTQMTQKLIELDYNVLYLDYDERWGFRKQERIDLWWRGVSNNSELMLLLAKFILSSPDWSHASVRVLIANNANVDFKIVENRIQYVLDQFRVNAIIKIVNNELDDKPIYELMKIHSSEADLIFIGIPEIGKDSAASFVDTTNNLVQTIGTTLMVKASSQFEETDLKIEHIDNKAETEKIEEVYVIPLNECKDDSFNAVIKKFDVQLNKIVRELTEHSVERIENYHHHIFSQIIDIMDVFLDSVSKEDPLSRLYTKLNKALKSVEEILTDAIENQLPIVSEEFRKDVNLYLKNKEDFIHHLPGSIPVTKAYNGNYELRQTRRRVRFRTAVQRIWFSEGMLELHKEFLQFGYQNLTLLHQSKNLLHSVIWEFLTVIRKTDEIQVRLNELKRKLDEAMAKIDEDVINLSVNFYKRIRNKERKNINQLGDIILEKKYMKALAEKYAATGPSTIKSLRKELLRFPDYWEHNVGTFTHHLIGDVELMRFSTRLQAFSDATVDYTERYYLKSLNTNFSQIRSTIEILEKALKSNDESTIINTEVQLTEEIFLNSELVVRQLIDAIDEALQDIPEDLQLMTAHSINEIRDDQGKNVRTERVGLRNIVNYLVKREFEDPIHEQIQLFYEQLKRAIGKLINASNLIQAGLDNFVTVGKSDLLVSEIKNAKMEVSEGEIETETAQLAFEIQLRDTNEVLKKELDVNQIIEQIDSLSQYVKQHKRRAGLKESIQSFNRVVGIRFRSIFDYFLQKQQDISATAYKRKYWSIVSEQGSMADFIDSISPKAELPFYYQQLYTTTTFSEGEALENRKQEMDQIGSAIKRIDKGASGGILILGSAGSGKSFLTTHIANFMLKGKTFHVHPPISKSRRKDDLIKALRRSTGIKENMETIMDSVPMKSTFVFQDLERWWMKTKDGEILLNEIAKLITKYGSEHFFLINANIHSYQLMSQQSFIKSAVSRSVILAPLTSAQIRDAIWSRHKSGGLIAHLNGESERHLSESKINKFLNRYHGSSNGVIGMALAQWIVTIEERKDNDLYLVAPTRLEFPTIERVELRNVIFQIFIHHSLVRSEFYKIYGKEHKNWIDRTINILVASGVVKTNEREAFFIDRLARPYVENWLSEFGFIK